MHRVVLVIAQANQTLALKATQQVHYRQMLPHRFLGNDGVCYLVRISIIGIGFQPGKQDDQYTKAMSIPKLCKLGKRVT